MQAPDLSSLLDFPGNFRDAAVQVARLNGISNVWTEMMLGNKTSPRVEVFFTLGDPTGHKTPLPGLTPQEYPHDAYNATLTWDVISNRETNGADHKLMCETVRMIMLKFRRSFGPDVLPFYSVNGVIPGQNAELVDKATLLDHTRLPYRLHFNIRGDAWPSFE